MIGANIYRFFLTSKKKKLCYLIATTTLLIGNTLFFVRKVEKNLRLNYQKDNTTSRDA